MFTWARRLIGHQFIIINSIHKLDDLNGCSIVDQVRQASIFPEIKGYALAYVGGAFISEKQPPPPTRSNRSDAGSALPFLVDQEESGNGKVRHRRNNPARSGQVIKSMEQPGKIGQNPKTARSEVGVPHRWRDGGGRGRAAS
jgi:hypothetical protein